MSIFTNSCIYSSCVSLVSFSILFISLTFIFSVLEYVYFPFNPRCLTLTSLSLDFKYVWTIWTFWQLESDSKYFISGYFIRNFLSISYGSGSPSKFDISFNNLFIFSSKSVLLSIILKWGCPVHADIILSSKIFASSFVSVLAALSKL